MDKKLQYATMLEIPANTCSITFKEEKKRWFRRKKKPHEQIKQELVDKVNAEITENTVEPIESQNLSTEEEVATTQLENEFPLENEEESLAPESTAIVSVAPKKKRKISIIGVQLAIIGVLIATIFLTNALYIDSGINVFLRSVLNFNQTESVDTREFDDFAPVISLDNNSSMTISDGVMTLSGKGSIYSPCDGVVSMCQQEEDGTYTIEITHGTNFKSLLKGLNYAYAGLNQSIYHNIPVGFVLESATMCFVDSTNQIIANYQVVDDAVIWAV